MSHAANKMGMWSIALITIVSVDSIRNLPSAASAYGAMSVVYYLIAGILFLIPAALCAADLSARFDEPGGIYLWTKKAFGKNFGFLAVWLQWAENVFWYPNVIILSIVPILYLFSIDIPSNQSLITLLSIVYFWILTLINLRGLDFTVSLSNFFTVIGLIIPMIIIIFAGMYWLNAGLPWESNFEITQSENSFGYLFGTISTVIVSFLGVEIATIHSKEISNPQKTIPKALMLSCVIILVTQALGALSIAIIVPDVDYSLGLVKMFEVFLGKFNLAYLTPVFTLCVVLGFVAAILNWIIAPTRGLLYAMKDIGILKTLSYENKANAPVMLLIIQACLVSVLCLLFYFFSVDKSILILLASTTSLYMIMYLIMFLSLFKLRHYNSHKSILPYSSITLPIISFVGALVSFILFFSIFFTGEHLSESNSTLYTIVIGFFIFAIVCGPMICLKLRKTTR